ncbi:hypothetical protein PC110_g11144 [Phytophthora cactorum]|uniref:Uncharacterized protein n=1 Tax=Phytophthora cactorum TaxID=29920 RepID=A0A329S6Y0_9STRA|nr:hypothetical protein PC110_g11144 [Phytophthora cactorum]
MSETQLSDQYLYQSSLKSDPEIKLNGSEGFASLRDAYIMLPYKVSLKNGATAQSAAANHFCATLKCGNWNVIDSMSLELNGKTIVSMADYKLFWNNIRAQTAYGSQYIEKHGPESFLYPDALSQFFTVLQPHQTLVMDTHSHLLVPQLDRLVVHLSLMMVL